MLEITKPINYRSDTIPVNPAASHFRELQVRQTKRPSPPGIEYLSSPHMKSYRNLLQYSGRNGNSGIGDDMEIPEMVEEQQRLPQTAGGMGPLSDEELQSLLLLLEEYQQEKSVPVRNFYSPPPQYFTPSMEFAGVEKRETGKRTSGNRGSLVLEQPMSFENSVGGDNYPVFLNQKRSKRVGNPSSKLVREFFYHSHKHSACCLSVYVTKGNISALRKIYDYSCMNSILSIKAIIALDTSYHHLIHILLHRRFFIF